MKKITLLAAACALFAAPAAVAQTTVIEEGVTVVEYDPANNNGLLLNSFKDNWFITAQGGVNVYFSRHDIHRDFWDRFQGNGALYFGKWFTPVWGARLGADFLVLKGTSGAGVTGWLADQAVADGLYKTNHNAVGPVFDVMANLTNLFCGYKPNRVYNFTLYMGAGGYWTLARPYDAATGQVGSSYKNAHDNILTFRAGFINSFNLGRNVQLFLDLRASALDGISSLEGNHTWLDVQAYLGLNFLINNKTWKSPVVPVCPPVNDCSELENALAKALGDIADLEAALRLCQETPKTVTNIVDNGPLATIYYPIGVSTLTREDNLVLKAVASAMIANPGKKYEIEGWADTYTGTESINDNLRERRAKVVYDKLVKLGVPADQLTYKASKNVDRLFNCNQCPEGKQYVSLNRATTITEVK